MDIHEHNGQHSPTTSGRTHSIRPNDSSEIGKKKERRKSPRGRGGFQKLCGIRTRNRVNKDDNSTRSPSSRRTAITKTTALRPEPRKPKANTSVDCGLAETETPPERTQPSLQIAIANDDGHEPGMPKEERGMGGSFCLCLVGLPVMTM